MTKKQLKQYLLDNGCTLETDSYYSHDGSYTKITNEFYITSYDECIKFCKVGKKKERISLFTGWEYNYAQCGHLVQYTATVDDVLEFLKDSDEYEIKLNKDLVDKEFKEKQNDELPF